jgi:hypothetical protein
VVVSVFQKSSSMPELYDAGSRAGRWQVADGRLIFRHAKLDVFWQVPDDFTLPSLAVLGLAEFLLLRPHGETVRLQPRPAKRGGGVAVAFSGGVDSAAALRLLPDPVPIYTEVARPGGLHQIENALLAVEEVGGISVVSNYDELPQHYGKRRGYFGTGGFTITGVLFSDYLNLRTICDGNVLETVYLHSSNGHGTKYNERDFSPVLDAFATAGLEYCMPCAGLTEVSTTRIAAGYRYAMGCMRGTGGKPCDACLKCFRKRALQGDPLPSNREVEKKLSGDVIPMLPSLLWARDNRGLKHRVLENVSRNISWVDQWYGDALRFIPEHLRDYFLARLAHYRIEPIDDTTDLKAWSSRITD